MCTLDTQIKDRDYGYLILKFSALLKFNLFNTIIKMFVLSDSLKIQINQTTDHYRQSKTMFINSHVYWDTPLHCALVKCVDVFLIFKKKY